MKDAPKVADGLGYNEDEMERTCQSCIRGKFERITFNRDLNEAKNAGNIIHSDICGPFDKESFRGSRYFISLLLMKGQDILLLIP